MLPGDTFPQRNTVYGGIFESMLIETFGSPSIFNEIATSFLNRGIHTWIVKIYLMAHITWISMV